MHRSLRALLVSGALVGTLVASLPASVSAATVTTRWVDADGRVSRTSCDGTSRSAYRTIQQGVDAANTADVVNVCPGTYVGRVVIRGSRDQLVLRAATSTAPVIRARDVFGASTTYLVTIDSVAGVKVKGFRIRPLRAPSHSSCSVSTGIRAIDATNVTITRNDIRPTGSGAFCGLYDGIAASQGTTGTIAHNVIRDFRDNGIDVSGASDVFVDTNRVTFAHVGLSHAGGAAILVRTGARAEVRMNTLKGPALGPGNPPLPAAGIELDSLGDPSDVGMNDITDFASGIKVTRSAWGDIWSNLVTGGQVSLELLDADRMEVRANTAQGATVHALFVAGGSAGAPDASKTTNADINSNDLRSDANGANADCYGESTPESYVVTQNMYSYNELTTSSPTEMCAGFAPS